MDVDRVSRELKKVPPMIAKIEKARGECASRIKVAAERLEEVNRAIEGQLANKLAITRDLQASRDHDAGLHTLMSASKVEEKVRSARAGRPPSTTLSSSTTAPPPLATARHPPPPTTTTTIPRRRA